MQASRFPFGSRTIKHALLLSAAAADEAWLENMHPWRSGSSWLRVRGF